MDAVKCNIRKIIVHKQYRSGIVKNTWEEPLGYSHSDGISLRGPLSFSEKQQVICYGIFIFLFLFFIIFLKTRI